MIFDWMGIYNSWVLPQWPGIISSVSMASTGVILPVDAQIVDDNKIGLGIVQDASINQTHIRMGG